MKKPFFSQIINHPLFLSAIAGLFLTGAASAQQAVAEGPFAIQEGTLEFTSEWIAIPNPLITTAALDLKVQASQETLADGERLSVIVEVEAGKSVTLMELGAGDNWGRSPMLIRSGLGELAQNSGVATRCRFIITGSSTSDATRIEISDLRVEETGRLPEDPLLDASLVRFEFYAGLLDSAGELTFTLGFEDLDEREALNFQVHYIGLVKPIDPATLGNDDICVDGEETFGFELEVSLVSSQVMPNADVIATYSLQRPEVGWEPSRVLGPWNS